MSAVLTVSLNGSGLDIPPDKAVEIGDHCWYYILSEEDKTAVFAGIDTTWVPGRHGLSSWIMGLDVIFACHIQSRFLRQSLKYGKVHLPAPTVRDSANFIFLQV